MVENIESFGEQHYTKWSVIDLSIGDRTSISQALEIYNESLGYDYIPHEELINFIGQPDKYVVLGSKFDNKLVGIMLSYILDEKETEKQNQELIKFDREIGLDSYKVGMIKSLAVDPDFRHRGIGTRLTLEAMRRLVLMGCDAFFANSWVSEQPESSQPMFEKLKYEEILRVEEYWKEDSLKEGYSCPRCGSPPCRCTAIFFFRRA